MGYKNFVQLLFLVGICAGQSTNTLHALKHSSLPVTDEEFIITVFAIVVSVIIGGIVAGLTIGLLSLDNTNLAILKSSGSPTEQIYAARIEPIRKNPHLLLVTLLLVNTIVNESLPILFDYIHFTGITAVICSTFLILIFGEYWLS